MDLIQQLKKYNIELQIIDHQFNFKLEDNSHKIYQQDEIEAYLLICLLNYIKI